MWMQPKVRKKQHTQKIKCAIWGHLGHFDKKVSESDWKDTNEESLQHCVELLKKESVQELFANYEYDEDYKPIKKPRMRAMDQQRCGNRIGGSFCCSSMFEPKVDQN